MRSSILYTAANLCFIHTFPISSIYTNSSLIYHHYISGNQYSWSVFFSNHNPIRLMLRENCEVTLVLKERCVVIFSSWGAQCGVSAHQCPGKWPNKLSTCPARSAVSQAFGAPDPPRGAPIRRETGAALLSQAATI